MSAGWFRKGPLFTDVWCMQAEWHEMMDEEKEIEKEKGPDLTIKLDTKKPEPPKNPADKGKPTDAKAAAAANPADPKNGAMKKGPQDE